MYGEFYPAMDGQNSYAPIPADIDAYALEGIADQIASGLYNLASMLLGEGEECILVVETAIANSEVSACQNAAQARASSRRALCEAALEMLAAQDPNSLAAPEKLKPTGNCIDVELMKSPSEDMEHLIAGPGRKHMRESLASLPTAVRAVFVLRAVVGLSPMKTAAMLVAQGGPRAAGWSAEAVRAIFREGLSSLASQLPHTTAVH